MIEHSCKKGKVKRKAFSFYTEVIQEVCISFNQIQVPHFSMDVDLVEVDRKDISSVSSSSMSQVKNESIGDILQVQVSLGDTDNEEDKQTEALCGTPYFSFSSSSSVASCPMVV